MIFYIELQCPHILIISLSFHVRVSHTIYLQFSAGYTIVWCKALELTMCRSACLYVNSGFLKLYGLGIEILLEILNCDDVFQIFHNESED